MFAHRPSSRSLSAYHDGELAPSTALEMEQHLERCDVCRGEYARLAKVANTARHFPRFDAPVSLARAIRRRVDEELRGMVPILRDELLSCRRRPNLIPAVSLGAFLILGLLGALISYDLSRGPVQSQLLSRWNPGPLPVPLQVEMSTPRFRDVNLLPFTDVARGKAGTLLTLASIDRNGAIRSLRVIHRSGDEEMLSRTLEVVRASGFEPARLGKQAVAVHFLYLFTTTEVRSKRII